VSPEAVAATAVLGAWMWTVGGAIACGRPAAERVAWGALAACALAWVAMVAGAAGIGLLGGPAIAAALALAAAAVAAARCRDLRAPRPAPAPLAAGAVAALVVALPGQDRHVSELWTSHGDMIWHLGWIHQLEAGLSAPGGIYAGEPNGYPWLFHALTAWVAQALPGGTGDAVAVVEWLGLAGAGTGTWLLARELGLGERAATWTVGLAIAAGGFGSVGHPESVFETHMHAIRIGPFDGEPAPVMTPSVSFLPPMIPRDLGLALTPAVLWIALRAARGERRLWWPAGFATGLVFLIAPLAGLLCALWILAIAVADRVARVAVSRAAVAAAAAAAAWLVPLGLAYRRYDGFVNITRLRFVEPSALQTLAALGVALPLALAGIGILVRRRGGPLRPVLILIAVPLAAVTVGIALADSELVNRMVAGGGAPTPLVRWLRYVPFLALALALPAGIAADACVDLLLRRRRRVAAALAAAAIAAAAIGSTATASISVWRVTFPYQLRCSSLPVGARTQLLVAGGEPAADQLSEAVFARTGASSYFLRRRYVKVRFRSWLDGRRPDQEARRDAVRAVAHGGPAPAGVDLVIVRRRDARGLGAQLGTCTLRGASWQLRRP
jgi:hypothetical protein